MNSLFLQQLSPSRGTHRSGASAASPAGDPIRGGSAGPKHSPQLGGKVRRALRKLIALAILSIGVAVLALSTSSSENAAHKDFISYWAAGRLLIQHANPYNKDAVFRLEKSAGFVEPRPLVMRNPPFALPLALPLGFFGAATGAALWSALIVGALVGSVRLLWSMHGQPPDRLHLLIYAFAPALACVVLGQTSTFSLLGLVLFLYLHEERPFWAGVCIPLLAIKPHLLVPFGAVLVLWMWKRRAGRVLLGAGAAAVPALLLAMYFDPRVCSDYLPVLSAANIESANIPTVSSLLRWASGGAQWLQYVPMVGGSCWAMAYFSRHRLDWNWRTHGSRLLLVSLWTAPYCWFTDEIMLAPALLGAMYLTRNVGGPLPVFAVIDGAAVVLVLSGFTLGSGVYIWTNTAWLIWYLYALRTHRVRSGAHR